MDHGTRWIAALAIAAGILLAGSARAYHTTWPFRTVRVAGVVLSDNGDDDGWADTNETVELRIRVFNASGWDLTGFHAVLSTEDPEVECLSRPFVYAGGLADREVRLLDAPFVFKLADVDRADLGEDLSVTFTVTFGSDQFGFPMPTPQSFTLDLDLDASGGSGPTTFFESFESGFGSFTTMHLDEQLNPPDGDLRNDELGVLLADGYRCQYSDPDWMNSSSYGNSQGEVCYPNPNGAPDAYWWQVEHDRAFSGAATLYFGTVDQDNGGFTSPTAQVEALRTIDPVNLGWDRVCTPGGNPCTRDADCSVGANCLPVSPVLSFKHQVSLMDHRLVASRDRTADRGIVQGQLADAEGDPVGPWVRLTPFVNVYDAQANSNYFNCSFDPVDDGNTEADFFDPTDPERRLGPSSTCAPNLSFSDQGRTGWADPDDPGELADGPGLLGQTGGGTWVESRFDLDRFRARRLRLRFLTAGLKLGGVVTWGDAFSSDVGPRDDGWFIDDVEVTGALESPATVLPDAKNPSGLPGLTDDDGDGLVCENCPAEANPDQQDSDGDGLGDACDDCPLDFANDEDGDGVCCGPDNCCTEFNPGQVDFDVDLVGDVCDNCPALPNFDQADVVHPGGGGDACDDPDGDGIPDDVDNCPDLASANQIDSDHDGLGSLCDNCPRAPNVDQADYDGDGLGDACDGCPFDAGGWDADLDGVADGCDNCATLPNADQIDRDGDGFGDACDNCPRTANADQLDWDQDGLGNVCDPCPEGDASDPDSDGLVCVDDNCPTHYNPGQEDADGDGVGDGCDPCPQSLENDRDGDGLCGADDNCPSRANADQLAPVVASDADYFRFTPDDAWIVYQSYDDELFSLPVSDGDPIRLDPEGLPGGEGFYGDWALRPDGAMVALVSDAFEPGRHKLYGVPITGGRPVELSGETVPGGSFGSLRFAADGSRLVYTYSAENWEQRGLFSVPVEGGRPTRLDDAEVAFGNAGSWAISPDGRRVVYSGVAVTPGTWELYSVDVRGGAPTRLSPPLPPGGFVHSFKIVADSSAVVYFADQETLGLRELFSVPILGGPAVKLNGPLVARGGILQFAVSPDGSRVVYMADQDTDGVRELYSVPVAGGPPTQLSRLFVEGRTIYWEFGISPDGSRVVYIADQETEDVFEIFSVPIGGGIARKLNGELTPNGHVADFTISLDGLTVVYRADQDTEDVMDLYSVPISGGIATRLSVGASTRSDYLVDDSSVLYAESADCALHSVPLGGGERTSLGDSNCRFINASDNSLVAYLGDGGLRLARLPLDEDADGVLALCDVCPEEYDPDQLDADGDGHGALCDCADDLPNTYSGAPEINDGLDNQCPGDDGFGIADELFGEIGFFDEYEPGALTWPAQPGAERYEVARSAAADFSAGCALTAVATTSWTDSEEPLPGTGFHYLVRTASPYTGSWGVDSAGTERTEICP